jgi:uncharacterized membrane protein YdjX (TVP38/TMEM64 family)
MEPRRAAIRRIALAGAFWLAVVGTLALTGNIPGADEARDFADDLGVLGVVLYVPLFVLANFVITWPILAGATGLLFGTAAGTALALLGITAASLTQMAIARWLAGHHRGGLLPQRTKRVENFLTENGTVAVMESRVVPLLPWGVVNYSAGLTHLAFGSMALGTIIGGAPKVFAYTALGGSLDNLTSPEALVAVGLLVVLALGGALFVMRQLTTAPAPEPDSRF